MAKTIVTQDGDIVNYGNLVIIFVRPSEEIPKEKYEIVGMDNNANQVILGRYDDIQTAENKKADIINWLEKEAYSTYEMPAENGES